jgi:hypothetical protein
MWGLEKRPLISRSLAVGTPHGSQHLNFTALLNGFKLEEVNLREQEDKIVG